MYSWDLNEGILVRWFSYVYASEDGYERHDEPTEFLYLKPKLKVYGKGM